MSRVSSAVDPGEGQPSDATIVSIAETLVRAAAQAALNKPRTAQPLAVFDAVSLPPLSLLEYARRIFKYFQCSSESAVLSLVYIDRFLQAQPDFTISELNLHRLLLTSAILAAKFFDDVYLFNSYYAQVGGVPLLELNNLEATFLKVVDYRLNVDGEVYNKYYALVHGESCFQVTQVPNLLTWMRASPTKIVTPWKTSSQHQTCQSQKFRRRRAQVVAGFG